MSRPRQLAAMLLFASVVTGAMFVSQSGAEPIIVVAEGEVVTGGVTKTPPMALQVIGDVPEPVLLSDHGEKLPWVIAPQRTAKGWDLDPQMLESGTYRIVAGGSTALFAVRAPSIEPPPVPGQIPFLAWLLLAMTFASLVTGAFILFPRHGARSAVAVAVVVASLLTGSPTPSIAATDETPASAVSSPPRPGEADPVPVASNGTKDGRPETISEPMNIRFPYLDNDGQLLLGPIGPTPALADCSKISFHTLDKVHRAAGCITVNLRHLGEEQGTAPVVAFWEDPANSKVDMARACNVSSVEWAAELSRRLTVDEILVGELNRCDYSYFTGIGAGSMRTAADYESGWERAEAFCLSLPGADDRYTQEIVQDKCHRGIGQGLAMRSGANPDIILEFCERAKDEKLRGACAEGAYGYVITVEIERDSFRLGGYWMDPLTDCVLHTYPTTSASCARFAFQELFRRGGYETEAKLTSVCDTWGEQLAEACALGIGEVQALYRDPSGRDRAKIMELCAGTGNDLVCLSRWLSTLAVQHSPTFSRELCKLLVADGAKPGLLLCRSHEQFIEWISSKEKFGDKKDDSN